MKSRICTLALALGFSVLAGAQVTDEQMLSNIALTAGSHIPYPVHTIEVTKAPKGYKPFYVSTYGRHGCRYLLNDNAYDKPYEVLTKAHSDGQLTELGEDVYARFTAMMPQVLGHGGELSPLGASEHKAIAKRLYRSYPEIFKGKDVHVKAVATTIPRVILSMSAFCESLKEENPAIDITRESNDANRHILSGRTAAYDKYRKDEPFAEEYKSFQQKYIPLERFTASLFKDPDYARTSFDMMDFINKVYEIAVDMQDIPVDIDFLDLFTSEELLGLWKGNNLEFYFHCGGYADGLPLKNACDLVEDFVNRADEAVAGNGVSANLRFGHDAFLMPLAGLLELNDCIPLTTDYDNLHTVFSDFNIVPMAGSVQMVLFRNKAGDVLVKFLQNERESRIPVKTDKWPFYDWEDVRAYMLGKVALRVD